jgi:hypothetical protein
LAAGATREWLPGPECENDWLCPACAANPGAAEDSLRLLCVHCIRGLRKVYNPKLSGRAEAMSAVEGNA